MQDENADSNSRSDDEKEQHQNRDEKNPIATPRLPRSGSMLLKNPVIARIRFEPERERVADAGNDSDEFVDQDVQ